MAFFAYFLAFSEYGVYYISKSKLQVLSFMFVLNYMRCHLPLNLMSFVLNVSKSCTLCSLG
ncbi:hypothetical protein HanIR_Chr14g0705021 [Helianthus annuus]|nr:hypothetical protein HanIR_Chr14g0705021 [Helianthus annuus]